MDCIRGESRLRQLGRGEGLDGAPHLREAVLAGWGETFREAQGFEHGGVEGGDLRRSRAVVEFDEHPGQAFHERRIGIEAEAAAAVGEFAMQPDAGDAARHAVRLGAGVIGQHRHSARAFDDRRETFVWILHDGVAGDELFLFFSEVHGACGERSIEGPNFALCNPMPAAIFATLFRHAL